jgi:hypothetical protein
LRWRHAQSSPTSIAVSDKEATEILLTLWLPDHIFVLQDGRRVLAMVKQRVDAGWLVLKAPDEELELADGDVAKVVRVPPVVMRGNEGVTATTKDGERVPELRVDPFPEDR